MTYNKRKKELTEALAEFTRLTGTGNVKLANLVMISIIHALVDLVELAPKGCGGNCKCSPALPPMPSVAKISVPPLVAEPVVETPTPVATLLGVDLKKILDSLEPESLVLPQEPVDLEPVNLDLVEPKEPVLETPTLVEVPVLAKEIVPVQKPVSSAKKTKPVRKS